MIHMHYCTNTHHLLPRRRGTPRPRGLRVVGVRRVGRLLGDVRPRRRGAAAPQDAAAGQGRREAVPRRGRRRDEALQEDAQAVRRFDGGGEPTLFILPKSSLFNKT